MTRGSATGRPLSASEQRLAQRYARGRVIVIDDDLEILAAFRQLIELEGYVAETFSSAVAYLATLDGVEPLFPGPNCVLCDVRMPEIDGLALQRRVAERAETPLVLMSGSSGAREAISGLQHGAVDFLLKPIDAETLLAAVGRALSVSAERRAERMRRAELAVLVARLTVRERAVICRVIQGRRNAEIAAALGIALRTAKLYRQRAMDKLEVDSLPDLVRIAALTELCNGLPVD